MPKTTPYGHHWRKLRLVILERDGHRCQIEAEGCKGVADQVDHIVPISAGGEWYAEENLRAACRPCNTGRGRGKASRLSRPSREW